MKVKTLSTTITYTVVNHQYKTKCSLGITKRIDDAQLNVTKNMFKSNAKRGFKSFFIETWQAFFFSCF